MYTMWKLNTGCLYPPENCWSVSLKEIPPLWVSFMTVQITKIYACQRIRIHVIKRDARLSLVTGSSVNAYNTRGCGLKYDIKPE